MRPILLILLMPAFSLFSQTISFQTTNGFAEEYNTELQTSNLIYNLEFNISEIQKINVYNNYAVLRMKNGNSIFFNAYNNETNEVSQFKYYTYNPEQVLNIQNPIANSFLLFPNPVEDTVFISFNSESLVSYHYRIYDVKGNLVVEKELGLRTGDFLESISVKKLVSGTYFIQLEGGEYSSFKQIIKK